MKKLSRIAALLAAAALLFGAAGCSGDDDDDPKPETVSVTGVSVSPDHVSVEEEQTATLTATVEPEDATNKTVRWAITGEDGVVEITDKDDGTATVKGVKKGETKITVTTEDGEFKKEVSVTVYAKGELVEVESVSISADKTEIEVDGTAKITATIEPKNATDKNLTWSAKPEEFVEITENEDGTATVKGKAAGTVTITATASNGVKSYGLEIEVKAKAGTPEENPPIEEPEENDAEWTGAPTTDSWDFVENASLFSIITGGSKISGSDSGKELTYTLSADATIKGSDENLTLTLLAGETPVATMTAKAPQYAVQEDTTDATSKGLRIKNNSLKISGVKGKVVLEFDYTASGTGQRNLEVTVGTNGTTEKKQTADMDTHTFSKEFDAKSGTNIYIGADNNYWIKQITITKQADSLTPDTNSDTKNDLKTLGLIGTDVETSDETVAVAELIDSDKTIKISSVSKAGSATVTVTNKDGKTAKIPVTVASSGNITLGTIERFTRDAPTLTGKTNANSKESAKGSANATWDGLTDLEYSADGTDFKSAADASISASVSDKTVSVTGLDKGTYYVRGAASDDYEATPALKISIGDDGAEKTTDSWDFSEINDSSSYTLTTDEDVKWVIPGKAGEIDKDYKITGKDSKLVLTACKESSGAPLSKNAPQYQAHKNYKFGIKNDALKIEDVKGTVTVEIVWSLNSSDNRTMNLYKGTDTVELVKSVPANGTTGGQPNFSAEVDCGEGTALYISTSNTLFITSITIK